MSEFQSIISSSIEAQLDSISYFVPLPGGKTTVCLFPIFNEGVFGPNCTFTANAERPAFAHHKRENKQMKLEWPSQRNRWDGLFHSNTLLPNKNLDV